MAHGMDEATLTRAMEPFFTTKGVSKGTGLGLSMVHGMAEQLGGRFVLNSAVGKGTTAEIWLPVKEGLAAPAPEAAVAVPQHVAPKRILVVDDDQLVLVNTVVMLEELGHFAVEASSAAEGLTRLRETPNIDMVITDHAMPEMTGVELARRLSADWPGLPVLLVSGYADLPTNVDTNLPRLAKPFSIEQLSEAVHRQTSKDQAAAVPQRQLG